MPENSRALIIGITGNIGSGKSSFCRELEALDCYVVYADIIAARHLDRLSILWQQRWGDAVLTDGHLDKKKLADIIFQNPAERNYLNKIIHPHVLKDFVSILEVHQDGILFFEIPLLFEANLQECFDFLVLVHSPRENVIERLQKRSGLDLLQINQRLKAQISDELKMEWVDFVVDNSGNLSDLRLAAEALLSRLSYITPRKIKSFL